MKKKVINSQLCNINTYEMYKREMVTLAENVFEFEGLPEYIDVSYLNKTLLYNGSIAFFYDDVLESVIALPYTIINGSLDIYNRPTEIIARARNGKYYKRLKKDEFVIMYDNNGMYSLYLDICQMAERIALSKRTIDVNVVQQRTPRVWKTTEDKKRSLQDILTEIDSMVERVTTYDSIDIDDMNVVVAPAPYVADKLDLHLEKEWSEFFRLVGIANITEQKRERVIKDEMSASQGGTIASRYSRFEPRKRALDLINKKFGTDIKVRYYDGEPTTEKEDLYVSNEFDETITNGL